MLFLDGFYYEFYISSYILNYGLQNITLRVCADFEKPDIWRCSMTKELSWFIDTVSWDKLFEPELLEEAYIFYFVFWV